MFITNYEKLFDYIKSVAEGVKPLLFQDNLRQISVNLHKGDRIALEKLSWSFQFESDDCKRF